MNIRDLDPEIPDPTPQMHEAMDRLLADDSMLTVEATGIGPDGWSVGGICDFTTCFAANNSRWVDRL